MTDLERARWLLPDGTDEVEVRELAGALAAARREGAEEMRERAAQEVEWNTDDPYIAAAVRALPLTPEEPP